MAKAKGEYTKVMKPSGHWLSPDHNRLKDKSGQKQITNPYLNKSTIKTNH
jgi:hypothetical protein